MPRNSKRGGPKTRARILEVANRMFLERGYEDVTVAEVAEEAGVSSVTVFNHFRRKEDLFLDHADDAEEFLRSSVRDREPGTDVLDSLHEKTLFLIETRHPLSGVNYLTVPFFRTVAASPSLLARAREIASDLQQVLADELDRDVTYEGDGNLLAACFIAGYGAVMTGTARRLVAGEDMSAVLDDHGLQFEWLFDALRNGFFRSAGNRDSSGET